MTALAFAEALSSFTEWTIIIVCEAKQYYSIAYLPPLEII